MILHTMVIQLHCVLYITVCWEEKLDNQPYAWYVPFKDSKTYICL